ncbi:MAG: class A beta-lactamase [Pyrinomonadaceae bacterium]
MPIRLPAVLAIALLTLACSWQTGLQSDAPAMTRRDATTPGPARFRSMPEKIDAVLDRRLAEIASRALGRVGIGAVLVETGDAAWLGRGERFATQSVYKLPIAMAALTLVDGGGVRIDQEILITPKDHVRRGFHSPIRNLYAEDVLLPLGEIVRYSISESDGTANDVLLDLAGGPEKVQQYLANIGVQDFIVADSTKSISKDWETQFRNWATPQASIDLLRALYERRAGLGEQTTMLLLGAMTDSSVGSRRLRRGLPRGATLAHKTGTGGEKDGVTSATNDVGIVTLPDGRHILIAVYIENSTADAWTRNQVMSEIARTVCERWYGKD